MADKKLTDLYVMKNTNPNSSYLEQKKKKIGSWASRAEELKEFAAGDLAQGETVGNGALGWLKDSADAGFAGAMGGTARFLGEFSPIGNDTLNSWADSLDKIAERNSPQPGQELEGLDYVASAVGNALGSGGASALQLAALAGLGSAFGLGGTATAVIGGASKLPAIGKAVQAGQKMWQSPIGKYLVGKVGASPIESMAESGNLISDMRKENAEGKANYTDEQIRDAAIRSGVGNLGWLTAANMLEAGTLGKITGALGGDLKSKSAKDIARRVALAGAADAISEGGEEYGQNLIGDYAKRANINDLDYDEALEAAKMGAIGGGVLGGLGAGLSAKFSKARNENSTSNEDGGTVDDTQENTQSVGAGREAFINAIAGQESGGDYSAVNARTGASGKYQIMPENWPAWAEEAGIGADAEMTPENQEIVARHKLGEYYDKYGARGAAIAWYAGEGALNYSDEALSRKQGNGNEPSINEYADSVLARMGSAVYRAAEDNSDIEELMSDNYADNTFAGLAGVARPQGFNLDYMNGAVNDFEALNTNMPLSEEAKAQRAAYEMQQRVKKSNELTEELTSLGNLHNARTTQYDFDVQQQSPTDALEHGFAGSNAQEVSTIDGVKAFDNKIKTNMMRKRAKLANGLRPDVAIDNEQTIPGSLYQMARSPREMANATNFRLQNGNALTDRSVRNLMLEDDGQQDVTARQARAAQEEAKRQGVIRAIAEQQAETAIGSRRDNLSVLANLLGKRAAEKWDEAEGEYGNRRNSNMQALANVLNARAAQQWDKAEQRNTDNQTRTQLQALADIVNARAAQQWDKAEGAEPYKFLVPQRQSMYDGAMRRNLAAQDRIQREQQPSVEPTPVNQQALKQRDFAEYVAGLRNNIANGGVRNNVQMIGGEADNTVNGVNLLPAPGAPVQRITQTKGAQANVRKPSEQVLDVIKNGPTEEAQQRATLRNIIKDVYKNDPANPLKESRRQLNGYRALYHQMLRPVIEHMQKGGRKAKWLKKYIAEHDGKMPSKKQLYKIAEDVVNGNDKYGVGYKAGEDLRARVNMLSRGIAVLETLEENLKENPTYGKEKAERAIAEEAERNARETANTEGNKAEEEHNTESDKDEVENIALPEGVKVDITIDTGKVYYRFSGGKLGKEFKDELKSYGFTWKIGVKAWVADNTPAIKALSDKLKQQMGVKEQGAEEGENKKDPALAEGKPKLEKSKEGYYIANTKDDVISLLKPLVGQEFKNENNGDIVTIGSTGINKLVSNAATRKSIDNGYTLEEHNTSAANIVKLFKESILKETHSDYKVKSGEHTNIKDIRIYQADYTVNGKPFSGKITVKETLQHGKKLYSIELMEIKKPEGMLEQPPNNQQTTPASGLSTQSVAQAAENVKETIPTKGESVGKKIVAKSGKTATVITDSGKELNVTYKLVPASRVITSHTANGLAINKDYPQELQPRDRQRAAMQLQISKMANNLRPADLVQGRNLNQGAPIVRSDGVVLNGNGRAIAIQTAQNSKNESAANYKKYLVEHAEEFGFKAEDVKGMTAPMLVRMVDAADEAATQDIINSTVGGSRLGASEQAKADAKKISLAVLERYVPNDKGDLMTTANRDFMQGILNKILDENDMNAYLDEQGAINADGIQRIKRALFQAAYGNDELIAKMAESTDDNTRNITNALTNAAPVIARVNAKMDGGKVYKYDLANTIAEAVSRYNALRERNEPLENYLSQQSMFGEYEIAPEVAELMKLLDEYKRKPNKLAQYFSRMCEIIEKQGNPNQEALFDGGKSLTLLEVIQAAGREEASLFDNAESKQGAATSTEESGENKKNPALAEGYTTESGRSLAEADENEFILHNGEKNFGEITQAVADTTSGVLKAAPIRLQVGNVEFGLKHLLKHEEQMQSKGFNNVYEFIDHVLKNFNQVYSQQTEKKPNRFVLYCKDDKSKGFMPVDLELKKGTDGYYTIVSAMPHKAKIKGTLIYDGSSRPSTVTTDSLLSSDTNGKGGADAEIVLAKPNVPLSTTSVAQQTENVKETILPKGVTAEITLNDKLSGVEIKFSGKPGDEVKQMLKAAKFRWSMKKHLWYAKQTPEAMEVAEKLGYKPVEKLAQSDIEDVNGTNENELTKPQSEKPKVTAAIFKENPDALINVDALNGAPQEVLDAVAQMPKDTTTKGKKPTQKAEQENTNKGSKWDYGNKQDALNDLLSAMGLKQEQKKVEDVEGIDYTDDGLDAAFADLARECNKLSANPMFNPALYRAAAKVGLILLKRVGRNFKKWANAVLELFRKNDPASEEKIKPFLGAIYKNIESWPKELEFKEDVVELSCRLVGNSYAEGNKNFEQIFADVSKMAGEKNAAVLRPYLQQAFYAVDELENPTLSLDDNMVQSKQDNTEGGSENGDNTSRTRSISESGQSDEVQGAESSGQIGRVSGQSDEQHERQVQRPENEPAEERSGSGGSDGAGSVSAHSGQGENSTGTAGRGTVPLIPAQKSDAKATEIPGHNYTITKESLGDGGLKTKYKNNVKAIKLLKQLEADGRQATPAEQEILANYVGWGGLAPVFNINRLGEALDVSWAKEAKELKELLTDEEYKAARASTTTAFYTPVSVIKNIYGALERLGFKGGKILEPSMGTGNFFGVMPESMRSKSSLNGVELDPLTGRIAKQLYQKANIEITGFEKAQFPDEYFDLAISNVPFGSFNLYDPKYNKYGLNIHNYFFAKAMDKVRPGGLVCFITSTDTMQGRGDSAKLRALLKGRADLVGAIRLPDTTFKANANTTVTSDIIILQKRKENAPASDFTQEWLETVPSGVTGSRNETLAINEYYKNHPEMVLGELKAGGQWGSLVVDGKGVNIDKAMQKAVKQLPADIYEARTSKRNINSVESAQKFLAPSNSREGSFVEQNGKVYHVQQSEMVEIPKTVQKQATAYVGLRDVVKKLLSEQINPAVTDEQLSKTRVELNKLYDNFVKEYGPVNDPKNIKRLSLDPDYGILEAIEEYKVDPLTNKVTVTKRAIFDRRTVNPKIEVTHADNVNDALALSLGQRNGVDLEYMSEVMGGKDKESILRELGDRVFENPLTFEFELAEEYLSGNVRKKLEYAKFQAEGMPRFKNNVEALEKVQPKDLEAEDISVNLGASWVPASDIQQFAGHLLGNSYYVMDVQYIPTIGAWKVDWGKARYLKESLAANQTWGTPKVNVKDLLDAALNQSTPTVYATDPDGNRYVDTIATLAARAKLKEIQEEFKKWIWTDKERTKRLVGYYNRNFNNWVLRSYDGSALNFPGYSTAEPQLKQHQKDVVWRILQDGTCLMAHCVGAGKTWSMQTAAMELKRLGLANKSMFVIPNHMLQQFENEFRRIYPNAKLLTIGSDLLPDVNVAGGAKLSKAELNKRKAAKNAKRQSILSKIATEDWDGVIISHNLFKRIPMSPESYNRFYEQQIEEVENAIVHMRMQDSGGTASIRSIVKSLEKTKKDLESKLKKNVNEEAKDVVIPFEQLGIDQIFVDEADQFKNLYFTTKMRNINGMSQANSQRSMDMFMKTQYLMNTNNGRGVVFATGTPISNTMAEMFTMLRYLDNAGLKEKNLGFFDNWVATFATKETATELAPDGSGYRAVEKFTSFNNMPELIKMFRKVADVKKIEDLDIEIPKLKNGKPTVVEIPMNSALEKYIKETAKERAAAIHNRTVKPDEDNMLKLTGDLRKASLDMRLVNSSVPASVAGSKIKAVAENVASKYKETDNVKGVQLVFCDLSTPKGASDKINESDNTEAKNEAEDNNNITVYDEIKKALIKKGIPANQIAFIHDAKTKVQKEQLFERCRQGQIRVLIGSTEKMGAGTNIQKKLVALHHVDAPWRPRDIEQREGRILRQGNDNKEVEIFNYVTKGSFDANMWEKLKNKATMIGQAMSGNFVQRSLEDADATVLSFAEVEALASGNPLMAERVMVNAKLTQMEALAENYRRDKEKNKRMLAMLPNGIKVAEDNKAKAEADIKARKNISGDNFAMVIGKSKTVYTERAKAKAELERIASNYNNELGGVVAKAGGFDIRFRTIPTGALFTGNDGTTAYKANESTVRAEIVGEGTYYCDPTQGSIEYAIMHAPDKALETANKAIVDKTELIKQLEAKIKEPFQYADQYEALKKRSAEIEEELNKNNEQSNGNNYSVSSEARQRTLAEVRSEIQKALPSAEVEQVGDNKYVATMPNGKKFGIVIHESGIQLTNEQAQEAGKAHNQNASEAEGYWSAWESIDGQEVEGVLHISAKSRKGTAFHETLHAAMDLCLTDKEKAALYKAFAKKAKESGRDVEEEIADGYKEWVLARQRGEGTMFGKLFHKVKDFLNKLQSLFFGKDNTGNIFRKLQSGEAWEQSGNVASSGRSFFSLLPRTIQQELQARGKAFRRAVEDVKNGVRNGREIFAVCDTPLLLQKLGLQDSPINMSLGIAYNNTKSKNSGVKHAHGVPFEVFEQIPSAIQDPVFVMESATVAGDIVIYTDVKVGGKSILVPMTLSKAVGRTRGNFIKSIYPRQNEAGFITKQAIEGRLLYVNSKKSLTWLGQGRVQFPPELTKSSSLLESSISKQLEEVNKNSAKIHYSVAPDNHKIADAFTNTERKGVVASVKDFFKEHKKNLYTDWIDKNNPLKGFDALTESFGGLSVYDQVQSLPATTAGMLKAICEGDVHMVKAANQHLKKVKMKHNVTLAMALKLITKKEMDKKYNTYLKENGFDSWVNAFGAYLGVERCLEMAELARAEGKVYKFPKGLTESECREFSKNVPQEFRAAADIFYKVNDNIISVMEDAEVFGPELAKALRTKYKKYCPLLRDFSDTAAADSFIGGLTEGGRGIGNVSIPLKKINIEGSERGLLNPLETILKSYAVMLNRAERNKVGLMAVRNAELADMSELIEAIPEKKDKDGNVVNAVADPKNCIFTVLVNGKKKAFKTTQDLYGPIVGYNLPTAGLCFNVARMTARMLRTGATISPSFIIRNFLRDTVFAGVASKNGFIPLVDSIRGAMALYNDPALRAEFTAAGVTEFNFYSSQKSRIKSLDAMAGEKPVGAWEMMKWLFSQMEAASDFVESSTRMGEFMRAKEHGLSMEEAARAAREITLDFSRSGRLGEQYNQIVPFFNACLQGGDKMVRLFREDPQGTSLKIFKYIVLPSLLLYAMNWDEDWYKDLDPDIKNNYWCFGEYLRIPKPQEAGVLFGSGIEALFEQARGKDKDAVENWLKAFASNMTPGVVPTLFLPMLEWQANYSYFKGKQLVGSKYQRLPDELQYGDYTSELSKAIGNNPVKKLSPMKIDNLVRGYTGTMGALLWSAPDVAMNKNADMPSKHLYEYAPFRDFTVTDANESRPVNEFYAILDKANKQHAGFGVKGKPEAAVQGLRKTGTMLSNIRKDIDKITHSKLKPERKRELIDRRKEKMKQLAKQANEKYGRYFE